MKMRFNIVGLDCPNCAAKLAMMIEEADGIETAKINFLTEKLTVESMLSEEDTLFLITKIASKFEDGIEIKK